MARKRPLAGCAYSQLRIDERSTDSDQRRKRTGRCQGTSPHKCLDTEPGSSNRRSCGCSGEQWSCTRSLRCLCRRSFSAGIPSWLAPSERSNSQYCCTYSHSRGSDRASRRAMCCPLRRSPSRTSVPRPPFCTFRQHRTGHQRSSGHPRYTACPHYRACNQSGTCSTYLRAPLTPRDTPCRIDLRRKHPR